MRHVKVVLVVLTALAAVFYGSDAIPGRGDPRDGDDKILRISVR